MAQVVYDNVDPEAAQLQNGVLSGKSFFFVQRLPMRSHFISQVKSNGGREVKLEAQADYIIADHKRQDAPPGSLSYTFIEFAIKNGELPPEGNHIAGMPKGTLRLVGSAIPGRSTRTPFTAEDDRVLYDWVKKYEMEGGAVRGNQIYKQLEAQNPRHTLQSWRDRYIKHLIDKPPEGAAPPTPPTSNGANTSASRKTAAAGTSTPRPTPKSAVEPVEEAEAGKETTPFTQDDLNELLGVTSDIQDIPVGRYKEAWEAYAKAHDQHTAEEWRKYWEDTVLPTYQKQEEGREKVKAETKAKTNRVKTEAKAPAPAAVSTPKHTVQVVIPVSSPSSTKVNPSKSVMKVPAIGLDGNSDSKLKRDQPDSPTRLQLQQKKRRLELPEEDRSYEPTLEAEVVSISSESESDDLESQIEENGLERMETSDADAAVQAQMKEEMQRSAVSDLTKENLAQMQAAHRESKRGMDIPPDDEEDDQENFAQYLEGIVNKVAALVETSKARHQVQETVRDVPEEIGGAEDEPLSNDDEADEDDGPIEIGFDEQLEEEIEEGLPPNSSQQEDGPPEETSLFVNQDDTPRVAATRQFDTQAIDPTLGLSSSPVRSQRQNKSAFETQYLDPSLAFDDPQDQQDLDEDEAPVEDQQDIELNLPEPVGGWDDFSPDSELSAEGLPSIESIIRNHRDKGKGRARDTQNEYTPQPVFEEQEEEDFDTQPPGVDSQALTDDEQDAFFEAQQARGYSEADIIAALKCTSMRADLAKLVLLAFRRGKGIPRDIAGIWTQEDDLALEGSDATKLKRLSMKHGWDECQARMEFLEEFRRV